MTFLAKRSTKSWKNGKITNFYPGKVAELEILFLEKWQNWHIFAIEKRQVLRYKTDNQIDKNRVKKKDRQLHQALLRDDS